MMGPARVVDLAFTVYSWILLARILMSWVRIDTYHPVAVWLYRLTEPVLAPCRRLLPPVGGLDFSPVLVFFLLKLVHQAIRGFLWNLGLW